MFPLKNTGLLFPTHRKARMIQSDQEKMSMLKNE